MKKILSEIELQAKMYQVLLVMHTNNMTDAMANNGFGLIFNVVAARDWREESFKYYFDEDQIKKIDKNTIIIRISYFANNGKYQEEFATVEMLDATDRNLLQLASDMENEYANKPKERIARVSSWKKP